MDRKTETGLTFDEAKHEYRLGVSGPVIDSVTQILKAVGISRYGRPGTELFDTPAMQRGKAVHRATELFDKEVLDFATVTDDVMPYLMAWIDFREKTGFQPSLIEQQVFHRIYSYAGTLDREGTMGPNPYVKFHRGQRVVIDIKTGDVEDWTALQLSGYDEALPKVTPRRLRLAVQLKPDGTWRPHRFDDDNDGYVFLSQVTNYNWRKAHGYLNAPGG